MQHRNTVLHRLLSHIRWHHFDAHVEHHASDKHVRTLSTKTQFIAMAYGQLAGADSLRETVTRFNSQGAKLYHLGAKPIARSTVADANAKRPSRVFEDLFKGLVAMAQRRMRQALTEATYLIDSTHLPLNEQSAKWARYSAGVCGAKVHVVYDPDADQPIYAAVSAANVNDITAAKAMPIEAGATYVFDLGYYDYGWWNKMHEAGCRIVTRLKKNTKLTITREKHMAPGGPILADRFGTLPKRQAHNRRNPMNVEMREIEVRIDTGKVIRVLTNDLTSSAQTIADLYKRRWAIDIDQAWRLSRTKGWMGSICNEAFWVGHRGSVFSSVRIRAADRQAIADQRGRVAPARRRGIRRARCRQDWRAGCRAIPDIGRGSA